MSKERLYIDEYETYNLLPGDGITNTSNKPMIVFVHYTEYSKFGKFMIKADQAFFRFLKKIIK